MSLKHSGVNTGKLVKPINRIASGQLVVLLSHGATKLGCKIEVLKFGLKLGLYKGLQPEDVKTDCWLLFVLKKESYLEKMLKLLPNLEFPVEFIKLLTPSA